MGRFGREFGVGHEAKGTEPVVYRERHNAFAGHALPIVTGLGAVARYKTTAVEVHQHG